MARLDRYLFPLLALFAGAAGLNASPAIADDRLLAQYVANLGPEDYVNSGGKRLTSFAALLAQDRANFHRFGIRHENDGDDPVFSSRAMRAQINPGTVQIPDHYRQYVANVMASDGRDGGTYMVVYVFGSGDRITRISIDVPG